MDMKMGLYKIYLEGVGRGVLRFWTARYRKLGIFTPNQFPEGLI